MTLHCHFQTMPRPSLLSKLSPLEVHSFCCYQPGRILAALVLWPLGRPPSFFKQFQHLGFLFAIQALRFRDLDLPAQQTQHLRLSTIWLLPLLISHDVVYGPLKLSAPFLASTSVSRPLSLLGNPALLHFRILLLPGSVQALHEEFPHSSIV